MFHFDQQVIISSEFKMIKEKQKLMILGGNCATKSLSLSMIQFKHVQYKQSD